MGVFQKKILGAKRNNWIILIIFLLAVLAGFLDYPNAWNSAVDWINAKAGMGIPHYFNKSFRLGLDLQGGTHLVYEADLSNIKSEDYDASMQGVRDVIERRVNMFGVAEPLVQINKSASHYRLIVELAGVRDIKQAIEMIGQTPTLDFREKKSEEETNRILAEQKTIAEKQQNGQQLTQEDIAVMLQDPYYKPTSLTGRFLKQAQVSQDSMSYEYQVNLQFNDEGAKLFEDITANNVGKQVAIYLDGVAISAPTVQEKISGGKAQITGNFSPQEAKTLAQRLNAGALPVSIKLISQETVGASLGSISLTKSLKAGLIGFLAVIIFMIAYYRFPGLLAGIALLFYVAFNLALFKLIPVTLTLSGIAGFILSIGMAVDANVLIFERMREELKSGKSFSLSVDEGFRRAWNAIRDSNLNTIIICIILYLFTVGTIRGFALTLLIGVIVSMFSAIFVTRLFLRLFIHTRLEKIKWLW